MNNAVKKDTSDLLKELENCSDFNSFYKNNSDCIITKGLKDYLEELLTKKGLTKAEAIKNSELNNIYGYQIFSGVRIPERKKLLSIAIGMKLDLTETQTLLKCSGFAQLYPKLEFDCIVIFGICKGLSVIETNTILYDHGLDTLG